MVGMITGKGLGFLNSSASVLGQQGEIGMALLGQKNQAVRVNLANGNLTLRARDEHIAVLGGHQMELGHSYNLQSLADHGLADDGVNGLNWKLGSYKRLQFKGASNTAGSSVLRIEDDGSTGEYLFDSASNSYLSSDGGGSYQRIYYSPTWREWVWTDTRKDLLGQYEIYDASGKITRIKQDQLTLQEFFYHPNGKLQEIRNASQDSTYFDYDSASGFLANIRTRLAASSKDFSRVSYAYDAQHRLASVTTDLTPENQTDQLDPAKIYTVPSALRSHLPDLPNPGFFHKIPGFWQRKVTNFHK